MITFNQKIRWKGPWNIMKDVLKMSLIWPGVILVVRY